MLKTCMPILLTILLTSCAPFVPVVKVTPEARQKAASFPIIGAGQKADYKVLTVVEGHSCQFSPFDPPASRVAAIEQAKLHAMAAGANAVTNLQCGDREGSSTSTNCYELISCTAEAVVTPN